MKTGPRPGLAEWLVTSWLPTLSPSPVWVKYFPLPSALSFFPERTVTCRFVVGPSLGSWTHSTRVFPWKFQGFGTLKQGCSTSPASTKCQCEPCSSLWSKYLFYLCFVCKGYWGGGLHFHKAIVIKNFILSLLKRNNLWIPTLLTDFPSK